MNTISNGVYRPAQKLHPLTLLAQYVSRGAEGCLQISSSGSAWFLYLEQGKLVYASDLTDPFGRLDRHLRLLSIQAPSLVSAVRVQVRLMFEEMPNAEHLSLNSDYRAICWLVEQQHLTPDQATTLIEAMSREVIGAFLPIQMGSHELIEQDLLAELPKFCQIDLCQIAEDCQTQFQRRQSALPTHESVRLSAYQMRPERHLPDQYGDYYGSGQSLQSGNGSGSYSEHPTQSISGRFNLTDLPHISQPATSPLEAELEEPEDLAAQPNREVSSASQRDPIHTAMPQVVSPAISPAASPAMSPAGIPPLNSTWSAAVKPLTPQWFSNQSQETSKPVAEVNTKKYTIACIDDSPTVLQAINAFLDDKSFSVVLISDPIKALMQVIRSRPDLILLDVTMPNLDGYELCSLLRKHPSFRGTPIVMVTGNTGFIDRAKAKLVGASGYLTKPFTQTDLIKMVFKHLT